MLPNVNNKNICRLSFLLLPALVLCSLASPANAVDAASPIPEACRSQCVTPYGKLLGKTADNIEAYSNCQSSCVVRQPNHFGGTYTGIKWQCVEYARRWLLVHDGVVFGDIDIAANMWDKINHVTNVSTQAVTPLVKYVNGSAEMPQKGDLLIYAREFERTGHVAVVVGVDSKGGTIKVAEENYSNTPWPGDYSREIPFIRKDGKVWLLDSYLIGWKRMQSPPGAH